MGLPNEVLGNRGSMLSSLARMESCQQRLRDLRTKILCLQSEIRGALIVSDT